ncbi:MAG: sialidase family protein, partial [candidate division Zixibacteria bacterium]
PALNSDVNLSSPFYGNLYIAYMNNTVGDMDIFFIRSEDNGNNWTEPLRINDDNLANGADQFHPWIAIDDTGVIHAIFYDRRLDQNNWLFDLYYTKSTDGGDTWSVNERITTVSSNPSDARLAGLIGEYIGLSAWEGEVQMVWTDIRNGNQDVFSARLPSVGACCSPGGACQEMTEEDCIAAGREWIGPGTECLGDNNGNGIDDACEIQEIPTLSEWGMLIMGLLLLTIGTVAVVRRRKTEIGRAA